jgi:putative addiction module component (TIGR02574 family)
MADFQSLFEDASRLPVDERILLIGALWDTLPDDASAPLSSAWEREIARRSADFDAGTVETIAWTTVRTDALRRASEHGNG